MRKTGAAPISPQTRQRRIKLHTAVFVLFLFVFVLGVCSWFYLQKKITDTIERDSAYQAALIATDESVKHPGERMEEDPLLLDEHAKHLEDEESIADSIRGRYRGVTYEILDQYRNVSIPAIGEYADALNDRDVKRTANDMIDTLPAHGSNAAFVSTKTGKFIVFVAKMQNENYCIYGVAPYSELLKDFSSIVFVFIVQLALLGTAILSTGWFIVKLDLRTTQTVHAEQERDSARFANQAKSEFVANMSHEIRTPINAILGMNEMIIRESKDPGILQYAKDIENAGEQLLSLVNNILDFSKIESGRIEIVNAKYSISDILTNVCPVIRIRAEQKDLEFDTSIDQSLPQCLEGDRMRIQQIIMNLLTNAVKYTDRGRVVFSITYEKSAEADDCVYLKIIVKDTGRGIRQEDYDDIFEKFARSDMAENSTIEGTGLGLSIVREYISKMGGEIKLKSEYGKGSVFMVSIPQKVVDITPIGDIMDDIDTPDNSQYLVAPNARILVVDDTPLNIEVISNLLKRSQMKIDSAESGEQALEKTRNQSYDIIFLDARMPHMDGVDTLNHLKGIGVTDTPIIVLTANVQEGARESYIADGFDDYLSKPVKAKVLDSILAKYLPAKMVTYEEDVQIPDEGLPAWIYKNEEINPDLGLSYCGNAENYLSTMKMFAEHALENMDEIKQAIESEDYDTFTSKVHALKSSSKAIGAERLSKLAENLENAGDQRDEKFIKGNLGNTLALYEDIVSSMDLLKEKRSEHKGIMIDDENISQIYRHLKEYVDDYNDEAVTSMLGSLSQYDFPGKEQERFDALVAASDAADWERIQELLEEF